MLSWFENRLNPYPSSDPAEPPRGLVAFCLHYLKGAKRWLVFMSLFSAAIALVEVSLYGFMGNIVDWLSTADKQTFLQTEWPRLLVMAVFALVLLPTLILFGSLTIHQTLLGNLPQRIRWMVHRHIIRQSMGYFQDEFAGRIAAKLMQTSLAVREVAMKLMDVLVYVIVYFSGAVLLAASSDWRLAIPFLVWLVAYVLLLRKYVPRVGTLSQQQADARSMMTGRIVDCYTNISIVKLFSHSSREEEYAKDAMNEFLGTVYAQMRVVTKLDVIIHVLNLMLLTAVAALGIWLWLQSVISAGAVAVAVALVLRFHGMAQWVMWEMSALFENIGTVRDGINSFSVPRLVRDAEGAVPLVHAKGAIQFEQVSFNYGKDNANDEDGRSVAVIDNLNLTLTPGEKIGLVGRSGSGKSTIVNLLLRFYDVQSGVISIDGQDISKVQQETLRGNIGVVTQDTSLLHRSVRDNIIYGRPDATDAEMIEAAKLAEAHEFIMALEDSKGRKGYDAQVGERGVKLSGGQRQRIAIARVLLKNPPILVLDEATSALDSEVEAAIQGQFEMLMQNKTVIAIAHRLSTIAAMDRLIVLDKGKIIEQGTHAELLELNGHYARLWQRQSGGFLDPDSEAAAAQ